MLQIRLLCFSGELVVKYLPVCHWLWPSLVLSPSNLMSYPKKGSRAKQPNMEYLGTKEARYALSLFICSYVAKCNHLSLTQVPRPVTPRNFIHRACYCAFTGFIFYYTFYCTAYMWLTKALTVLATSCSPAPVTHHINLMDLWVRILWLPPGPCDLLK